MNLIYILNLEVVEHVEDLDLYLKSCFELLKPTGIMFTATINRTLTSYVKAIIGAEYVLRWLPIGTHDWNKFIKPEELKKKLTDLNFSITNLTGLSFNPIFQEWKRSKDVSVNYIITSKKTNYLYYYQSREYLPALSLRLLVLTSLLN